MRVYLCEIAKGGAQSSDERKRFDALGHSPTPAQFSNTCATIYQCFFLMRHDAQSRCFSVVVDTRNRRPSRAMPIYRRQISYYFLLIMSKT